ncbi:MAG: YfhO family protein [bacterium]
MIGSRARWLAIVLVAAAFFAPELFGGRVAMTSTLARWRPWSQIASPAEQAAPSHNPDCATSYYPRRHVMHEAWKERRLPTWNPDSFGGTPFLADPQAEVLYPPNVALAFLDPRTQLGWFLFLHVAWAGLGLAVVLRRSGVSPGVAVLAGATFALNGWFAKHFGQPPFLAAAAWLPWIVLAAVRARDLPTPRRAAVLGLTVAVAFLAGQPQITLQAVYAATFLALAGALAVPGPGRPVRWTARLATVAFAAGIALLLVAPQLLPTLDLASRSARAVLPYETVISGAFHPVDSIRFVVPEFFGSPLTRDEWAPLFPRGDGFYLRTQINSLFASAPVFVFALIGMVGAKTRRRAWPFTVLFVLAVLVAFGTPLAQLAYWLPGFRFSRMDRLGTLIVFAQFVPAALAAGRLAEPGGSKRRILGALIVGIAVAGALITAGLGRGLPAALGADVSALPGGLLPAETAARVVLRTWTAAAFAAGAGFLLVLPASRWLPLTPFVLGLVQLAMFASPYRGDRPREEVFPPDAPGISELADTLSRTEEPGVGGARFVRFGRDQPVRPYALSSVLPPSTNVPYGVPDLQGYNALCDRRLGDALELATGENLFSHGIWTGRRLVAPTRSSSLEHPLLDALSVGAAAGVGGLTASGWASVESDGFRVWRNRQALPRIRLTSSGRGVSPGEMERRLRSGDLAPWREVLWVGAGQHGSESARAPGTVRLLRDEPEHVVVQATLHQDGVLVVADSNAPGWTAWVDGRKAEILPAWGLVRAVTLGVGEHVVEMRYSPPGFRLGLGLAALGALLVIGAFVTRRAGALGSLETGGPGD